MSYDPHFWIDDWEVNAWFLNEDFIWMQFTWLLDKNWKEIYENDIVTVTDSWEEYLVGNYMVKANSAGYYLNRKSQYWWLWEPEHFSITHPSEFEWQIWNIEVIWNIYENPELLTNTYGK